MVCMIFIVHTIAGDQPLLKMCWLDAYIVLMVFYCHKTIVHAGLATDKRAAYETALIPRRSPPQ